MFSYIKNYLFPDYSARLVQYSRDGNLDAIKHHYIHTEDVEEICISLAYQYDHFHVVEFFLDQKFYVIYRLSLGDDEEKLKRFFLYFWEANTRANNEIIINHILCSVCENPVKFQTLEYIFNVLAGKCSSYINSPNSLTNPLRIACRTKNKELIALLLKHGAEPDENNLTVDDVLFLLSPIIKNVHLKDDTNLSVS